MASSDEDELVYVSPRSRRSYRRRTHSHGSMTTSCDENDEDPSEQKVGDITIKFFYKPRTLTALALCILAMLYFAFVR